MSLTPRLEAHYVLSYTDNVAMLAQQLRPRLRGGVTETACTGEAHSVADLVGLVEADYVPVRIRGVTENPPELSRRWLVQPNDWIFAGAAIDKVDKLRMMQDPTSVFTQSMVAAVQRKIDHAILGVRRLGPGQPLTITDGGILGAATTGKTPGSKVALPDGCYEPAGSTGLTLDKLIATKERLNLDEFGMEEADELYCAITPRQVTDLLNIAAQTDQNLNAFQLEQLKTGRPTSLMAMTWVVTNDLPLDSAGKRMCPVWSRRNIVLGIWEDVNGTAYPRPDWDNTPYARVRAMVDCARVQDKGVHVILCTEG
jgi:hypothetical protein